MRQYRRQGVAWCRETDGLWPERDGIDGNVSHGTGRPMVCGKDATTAAAKCRTVPGDRWSMARKRRQRQPSVARCRETDGLWPERDGIEGKASHGAGRPMVCGKDATETMARRRMMPTLGPLLHSRVGPPRHAPRTGADRATPDPLRNQTTRSKHPCCQRPARPMLHPSASSSRSRGTGTAKGQGAILEVA